MSVILTNCNVVDVESGSIRNNSTVHVEDGRIKDIREGESSSGQNAVDLSGGFLLPGLFNVHCHLSLPFSAKDRDAEEPEAMVALRCYKRALDALNAGVTTLRTVDEQYRCDISLRNAVETNRIRASRIIAGGKGIGSTGGHGGSMSTQVDGPAEFLRATRRELAFGADHIKIFLTGGLGGKSETLDEIQMTRDEIEAVVAGCRSKDTYVAAHAGGSEAIIEAAGLGVTSFEHGYHLNKAAAEAIRRANGFLVPTLSVTHTSEWYHSVGWEEWLIRKSLSAADRHLESLKTAINENVPIVCGTDIPPGDMNGRTNATVREIELLSKTDLQELGAIQSATINAAKLCRRHDLGSISQGFCADIIAVPGNPLEKIEELENIFLVIKGGEVIKNEQRK